jgi:hypothetical protein
MHVAVVMWHILGENRITGGGKQNSSGAQERITSIHTDPLYVVEGQMVTFKMCAVQ